MGFPVLTQISCHGLGHSLLLALLLHKFTSPCALATGVRNSKLHNGRGQQYDELLARHVINYTEAAYCTDDLVGWNCTVCRQFPGMTNVSVLQGQSRNVRGFVGLDLGYKSAALSAGAVHQLATDESDFLSAGSGSPRAASNLDDSVNPDGFVIGRRHRGLGAEEGKRIDGDVLPSPWVVVTFSGTDPKSMKNWIDDLEAAPVAHPYGTCDDCKVHRGFVASYDVVQDQVRAAVSEHLRYNPGARILITGHSLGGALATLCFLDLYEYLGATTDPATSPVTFAPLHTFGAPRVGNAAFAAFMVSRGVPIYRVVHHRDPVPHVPFTGWGYWHPSSEIFYNNDQTGFAACDETGEDPSCSDQFWVLPDFAYISDHLHYLEVQYPKAYLNCLFRGEGADGSEEEKIRGAVAADAIEWEWEELGKELAEKYLIEFGYEE